MKILNLFRRFLVRIAWLASVIEGKKPPVEKGKDSPILSEMDGDVIQRTDPVLMTRKERYENTIRIWMEYKGYSRKEIDLPLTNERLREIGRTPFANYGTSQDNNRKAAFEKYPKLKTEFVGTFDEE